MALRRMLQAEQCKYIWKHKYKANTNANMVVQRLYVVCRQWRHSVVNTYTNTITNTNTNATATANTNTNANMAVRCMLEADNGGTALPQKQNK